VRTVVATEGVPFTVDDLLRPALRNACRRLERNLRPSVPVLEEAGRALTVRGVLGTVAIRPDVILDVAPRVGVGDDWVGAVLDLLTVPDRIDIAGDRRAGTAPQRNLVDALAAIYWRRLAAALRRDGPILVMERRESVLPVLKGKVRVSEWARRSAWEPHRFPVAFQELTSDNDYSRALAYVAGVLAHGTRDPRVRDGLLGGARQLRPGAPELTQAASQLALRRLPTQWAAYEPAWDIAASVLSRRSLLGSVGARHGVSVAIEAWPLLERLLQRSLQAAVRAASDSGRVLVVPPKSSTTLLSSAPGHVVPRRGVIPDGRLLEGERQLATFEAKYARFARTDGPPREHVYQALSTAAACGSPTSILVYPETFDPAVWEVRGFDGRPARLVAVGLGLFRYRRGSGDRARGRLILDALDTRT
jgi:hypothetical protein